jgi:hypothetical protein
VPHIGWWFPKGPFGALAVHGIDDFSELPIIVCGVRDFVPKSGQQAIRHSACVQAKRDQSDLACTLLHERRVQFFPDPFAFDAELREHDDRRIAVSQTFGNYLVHQAVAGIDFLRIHPDSDPLAAEARCKVQYEPVFVGTCMAEEYFW